MAGGIGAVVCILALAHLACASGKADDAVIPVPIEMGLKLTCYGTGEKAIREPAKEGLRCCQNIKWKVPRWVGMTDGSIQDHGWNEKFTQDVDLQYELLDEILNKPVGSYPPVCLRTIIAARCILNFSRCKDGLVQIPCRKACHQVRQSCQYDMDSIEQFNCDESIWDQDDQNCINLEEYGLSTGAQAKGDETVPLFCTFEPKGKEVAYDLQKEMHELKETSDQARRHPDEQSISEMRTHISAVAGLTKMLNTKVDAHMSAAERLAAGMPEKSSVDPLVRAEDLIGAPSSSVEYGGNTGPSEQIIGTKDSTTAGKGYLSIFTNKPENDAEHKRNAEAASHFLTHKLEVEPNIGGVQPNPGGDLVSNSSENMAGPDVESESISVTGGSTPA